MQPDQNTEPKPAMPARTGRIIQPISSDMQAAATPLAPIITTPPSVPPETSATQGNTPPSFDAAPVYPTATVASFAPPSAPVEQPISRPTFLHANDLAEKPQPLPPGIYLIVFLAFIGFLTSFFGDPGIQYTVSAFVNLILAGGLLLRMNGIRILAIVISSLTCAFLLLATWGVIALQQRVKTEIARYDQVISQVDKTRLTSTETAQLAQLNTQMDTQKAQAKKAFATLYQQILLNGAVQIFVIVYLTRPGVRQAFRHRAI